MVTIIKAALLLPTDSSGSVSGVIISWRQNMTTKRAQDSTIHRIFLRKVFFRCPSIFAELPLGPKDLDVLFVPFDEIDEINVPLEDSLWHIDQR